MEIYSIFLLVSLFGAAAQANAKCSELAGATLSAASPEVTINIAEYAEIGSTFQGETLVSSYNTLLSDLPAHCRIAAQFNTSSNSTVHFEIWLPEADLWNRRFLAFGNGGWAGGVNYPDVARGLKGGFAAMSTNTGHNSTGDDGSFFQYPEQNIDFGHRGLHLSVVHSKIIIAKYYSQSAAWSYYSGCSTGGRQGMAEAQLYPDDFDGVLVGSPVIWQTHEEAWEDYAGIGQYPNTLDSFISTTQWSVIHDEVLRQCDLKDGVKDKLVSDPERCDFVPESLLCKPTSNTSECLTAPQLANLKTKYAGWTDVNNTLVFPGILPGSELTGIQYYTNADVAGGYGLDYYRYAILNDTSFEAIDITYEDVQIADKINTYGALADAFSPDLTGFQKHGGKLLHYHGWQDSVVTSRISPLYYSNVLSFYSELGNSTKESVQDFYRLFMIPGLGHCTGGDGAWVIGGAGQDLPSLQNDTTHSMLLALIEWREGGEAPNSIIGTKYVNETVIEDKPADLSVKFTRPSCQWPSKPEFQGGNVTEAKNWKCSTSWLV